MSELALTHDDIIRVTQELWRDMLCLDITPVATANPPMASGIVATVEIAGEWQGMVRLDISSFLARQAAAAFLGVPTAEVSRDQLDDTAGELANITGGSIKALVPAPSKLSLPTVAELSPVVESGPSGPSMRSVFYYQGENLVITIMAGR